MLDRRHKITNCVLLRTDTTQTVSDWRLPLDRPQRSNMQKRCGTDSGFGNRNFARADLAYVEGSLRSASLVDFNTCCLPSFGSSRRLGSRCSDRPKRRPINTLVSPESASPSTLLLLTSAAGVVKTMKPGSSYVFPPKALAYYECSGISEMSSLSTFQ